jgi:hypothetical protein
LSYDRLDFLLNIYNLLFKRSSQVRSVHTFWAGMHSNGRHPTEMKSYAKNHTIETCSFIICYVGHWKEKQGNQEGQEDAGTMDFILCPGVGNYCLFLQRLKSISPHFPGWGGRGFTLTGA